MYATEDSRSTKGAVGKLMGTGEAGGVSETPGNEVLKEAQG